MTLGTIPAQSMDPYLVSDLQSLAGGAAKLKRCFSTMGTPTTVDRSMFQEYEHLQVEMAADGLEVIVRHLGTCVGFKCLIAIAENHEPVARVICTLNHELWGPPEKFLLGAFAFDSRGYTDLPGDERGQPTRLPGDADRVIAYFLHKAHRLNATLHGAKSPIPEA